MLKRKTHHLVEALMLLDEAFNHMASIDMFHKKSLSKNQLYDWKIAYHNLAEALNYTRKVLKTCKDNPFTTQSDSK